MITAIDQEATTAEVPAAEVPVRPTITIVESGDRYGKFVAEPLERGFGHTLGNGLRRVLLGSLPGAAITAVQIQGVQHEYSTIAGVREDVSEILLNIKTIRLRAHSPRPGVLRLEVKGPGQVTAADIQPSADYEVVNPEQYIASLDSAETSLSMELHVNVGAGYETALPAEGHPIGFLPLDAIYTPTRKVNYGVDKTRVGQITDFDRLTIEVWTDGSKSALESVREAAQILMDGYSQFAMLGLATDVQGSGQGPSSSIPAETYNMLIEKLDLSARTLNCLKRSKINKVGEILEKSQDELLKIKNFGEKSLQELNERLAVLGIKRPEETADPTASDPAAEGAAPAAAPPAMNVSERRAAKAGRESIRDLSALKALLGDESEPSDEDSKAQ